VNLYILRHGIAVERSTPGFKTDAERPLTPKGKRQLRQIATALQNLDLDFNLILSSPLLRARQTAEIIARSRRRKKRLAFSDELKPGGNPKALIQQLNGLKPVPENVLLVGHEPYLSQLIGRLISGNATAGIGLKKGGLGKLEMAALRFGRCATLAWLFTPNQMKGMA
jgi:phosphohistidine phosphatase